MSRKFLNDYPADTKLETLDLIEGGTMCDQCNEYADRVVVVGEDYDWETSTALVCRGCLVKALAVIDGAT